MHFYRVHPSVRVIIIILVQELDIALFDQLSDHRHIGAIHGALPLEHDPAAEIRLSCTLKKYREKL